MHCAMPGRRRGPKYLRRIKLVAPCIVGRCEWWRQQRSRIGTQTAPPGGPNANRATTAIGVQEALDSQVLLWDENDKTVLLIGGEESVDDGCRRCMAAVRTGPREQIVCLEQPELVEPLRRHDNERLQSVRKTNQQIFAPERIDAQPDLCTVAI